MDADIYNSLAAAIHRGELEEVKKMINQFGLPHEQKYALLCDAVQKNFTEIIKLLVTNGCRVNCKNNKSYTPLHLAIENGNIEITEILLQRGADVNVSDEHGLTPLHLTVYRDVELHSSDADVKEEILEMLLSRGADVNAQNVEGMTALHHAAAKRGCEKLVEVLLKYNADVNSKRYDDWTPLHNAAAAGNEAVIEILLDKGADIDARDRSELTAFHAAMYSNHLDVLKLLLKCGAKIINHITDRSPLHLAVKENSPEIIENLLELGIDIDSRDQDGKTPLHFAAISYSIEAVAVLLENGSDINIVCKDNYTSFDYALINDHLRMRCEPIIHNFSQHVTKMMCANLYVRAENIACNDCFDDGNFLSKCKEEVDTMKREKINNNISFYDILTKSINQLAIIYARNENIEEVIKLADCKLKFPLYASMICNNFKRGMKRKELLEESRKILCFNGLPYNFTEKIYSHLSDEDLRNLINACKL